MKKLWILVFLLIAPAITFANDDEWFLRHGSDCFHFFGGNKARVYHDEKLYDEYTFEYICSDKEADISLDMIEFKSLTDPNGEVTISLVVDPITYGWFVDSVNKKIYDTPLHFVRVDTWKPFKKNPNFYSIEGAYADSDTTMYIEYSLEKMSYEIFRKGAVISGEFLIAKGDMKLIGRNKNDPLDCVRIEINDYMQEKTSEYIVKIRTDNSLYFKEVDPDNDIYGFEKSMVKIDYDANERGKDLIRKVTESN